VSINVNASTKCKLGTVTSTGTFRMGANGPGGTVQYHWTRKDSTGTYLTQVYSIVVAAGDTAAHSVVTDSWIGPADSGTVQLVFTTPGYAVAPQSFTCRP
jgi:hypothetical protein